MPLLYVLVAICMMLVGAMLTAQNPEPTRFAVNLFGRAMTVEASIVEIIGYSIVLGSCAMSVPYLRTVWYGGQQRRQAERATRALSDENARLRRETENAHAEARLLEARVAEAEERYARLEAEVRPLLTMKREPPTNGAPPAEEVAKLKRASRQSTPSRWRRR